MAALICTITSNLNQNWKRFNRRHKDFLLNLSPQQNLIYGFFVYTLIGWLFLCLPFLHKEAVAPVDSLFIATSAISTTGLVTVSLVDTYTWGGQFVVMILIQIGGIGYMTLGSFIILSRHNELTHEHKRILFAEFSLPVGFRLQDFLKSIIIFTGIAETVGAVCLFSTFRNAGVDSGFAAWSSVFHSVSAFCTAGFGLYNDSFEGFAGNTSLSLVLSGLSLLGSLGFIVFTDIWYRLSRKSKAITFTTKVIVLVLLVLLLLGTLIFYINETRTMASPGKRLLISFFQTMTALTTVGFNTIPIGDLPLSLLLVVILLMFVGASPSGTGGGLKSTTLTAILAIMWCRFRGFKRVTFLGRTIPFARLYIATSSFIFYSGMIFFITLLLSFTENFSLIQILFETASALGTVGLSMGITADLTVWGKLLLIVTMFVGRVGVLTFGLSILAKRKGDEPHKKIEDLAV